MLRPLAGSGGAGLRPGCGRRPAAFGLAGRRASAPASLRPGGCGRTRLRQRSLVRWRMPGASAPALGGRFPAAARLSPALLRQERRAGARRLPAGSPARLRRIRRLPAGGPGGLANGTGFCYCWSA